MHKITRSPVHHRFISNRNDLHDIRKLGGIFYGFLNLTLVILNTFLAVIRGQFGPRVFTVYPSTQHHIHLKGGIFFFQLANRAEHIRSMIQL